MNIGQARETLARAASSPLVEPSRCLRMRFSGSRCDRCAVACQNAAICLEGHLEIREEICTGCHACTASCPSGALEADIDFGRALSGIAAQPHSVLVISCGASGFVSRFKVPCLGMLSSEHLVAIFAKCGSGVQLDASACSVCPAGTVLPILQARLEKTAGDTGLPLGSRIRLVLDTKNLEFRRESMDRRGFFRSFRKLAIQGAGKVLASPSPQQNALSYMEKRLPARRKVLSIGLASLSAEAAGRAGEAFSYSVTFGESCERCLGCAKVCPTGALHESCTSGSIAAVPRFDTGMCTGCGLCAEFCLPGAVHVEPAG